MNLIITLSRMAGIPAKMILFFVVALMIAGKIMLAFKERNQNRRLGI